MRGSPLAVVSLSCAAALLAGCGGGGGTASTPSISPTTSPTNAPALALPGLSTVNQTTTYTVYQTSTSGTLQIGIAPISAGPPSSDPGWTVVSSGAEVFYPDGSVQLT